MSTCSYNDWIDAYHDGQLPADSRIAFEKHLAGCIPCQADLAQTRQLSAIFAAGPKRTLSHDVRRSMLNLAPMIGERAYLRLAEWTTALAASVLIGAAVWLYYGAQPQSMPNETVANSFVPVFLNPPKEHDAADVPDDPKLVDWVTTNVSVAQNP